MVLGYQAFQQHRSKLQPSTQPRPGVLEEFGKRLLARKVPHRPDLGNTLENIVLYLAGRCDGANASDDAGFDVEDVHSGHRIAAKIRCSLPLSRDERAFCSKCAEKYRKQLLLIEGMTVETLRDLITRQSFKHDVERQPFVDLPLVKYFVAKKMISFNLPLGLPVNRRKQAVSELFALARDYTIPLSSDSNGSDLRGISWRQPRVWFSPTHRNAMKLCIGLQKFGFALEPRVVSLFASRPEVRLNTEPKFQKFGP